ncbi:hypothetical protein BDV24DRAFT_123204 [Aspergillus arachidicola]|uniref:Uncharacterized protein n=1 Tax=Aspergillus arachidicola TaxID=656916 RepID=A0A5N6YQM1_9EURO|nr:hypothetical protein BDV24DRAFT_123204 [Aspergillus arachidicola]
MWGISFQSIVSLLAWPHVLFSRIRHFRFCFCFVMGGGFFLGCSGFNGYFA